MKRITGIALDMDGVLADFIEGACLFHNKPNPYDEVDRRETWGEWDVNKLWGMSATEFWKCSTYEFWKGLKPYDTMLDLVANCISLVGPLHVVIITSPPDTNKEEAISGKRDWILEHLGSRLLGSRLAAKVHFTKHKYEHAEEGMLLIDDSDKNVRDWREKPGCPAILVPRPWNSFHWAADISDKAVSRMLLDKFKEST